jgi:ribose 1,5-bisphosphokinase PhnN
VALDAPEALLGFGEAGGVHRRHGVHGVDLGRAALRPDAVEPAESRARIAAARESSRVAAAALPTSPPLKVVQRRLRQRGRGAPAADTERRLEELERAGIDGFDRSLIPRVEWL